MEKGPGVGNSAHRREPLATPLPGRGFPDHIDVFVDGQKYFTFRNEGTGPAAWPFDKPQYLLINLAIGGSWGGQRGIDDARFPHRYLVDYVRIYQQR